MPHRKSDFIIEVLALEPALKAFLTRFVRQSSDVEDLVQETYARLLRLGDDECRNVDSPRRFAFTVARNLALDWLRHRQVISIDQVTDFANLDVYSDSATVEDLVSGHQELMAVERAVARLPAKCRTAFILRKVHGYSQREISEHMSISENTVERHLVKALKRIRAYLARLPQQEIRSQTQDSLGDEAKAWRSRGGKGRKHS